MSKKHINILRFRPNEYVINQGEFGDCVYMVEKGELDCYKQFVIYFF